MVETPQAQDTSAVVTSAPVIDSAVAAPAASTEAPLVVAETPAETPAPVVIESVLGDIKPADMVATEVRPTDIKTETPTPSKTESEKSVETKTETPAKAATEFPKYDDFKVPENVKLDKEPLDAFTKILGEIETGKLDHLGMQEKGQALIDLAAKSTKDSIDRLNDYYVQFHENQKKQWFDAFKSDPDMGGDKLDQTVGMLRDAVEQNAGSAEQLAELRSLMKDTGVGNHPALTRLIYNMQQKINKFTTEGTENRMVPGGRPAPSKVKDYQRFYGGS